VFAPVADHPATELALVNAYRELRDVSAETLDRLADQSDRAADIVRLHRLVRAQLKRRWYDEEDLVSAAIETLSAEPIRAGGFGVVVLYLPQRLTRHGALLIDALAGRCRVVVVAGATGDARAE
jgi:hypothetical protein